MINYNSNFNSTSQDLFNLNYSTIYDLKINMHVTKIITILTYFEMTVTYFYMRTTYFETKETIFGKPSIGNYV